MLLGYEIHTESFLALSFVDSTAFIDHPDIVQTLTFPVPTSGIDHKQKEIVIS